MSVENVVNNKQEFLNHIYQQLSELLNTSNIMDDQVLEYDKMKLEEIRTLDQLCDIDFKRFFHQIYNENGELNDIRKIARLSSLYHYNEAMVSYSDIELDLFVEATATIPSEYYAQYDNHSVALFSNREIAQNIMSLYPDFESQLKYIKAYMEGCQITMEEGFVR